MSIRGSTKALAWATALLVLPGCSAFGLSSPQSSAPVYTAGELDQPPQQVVCGYYPPTASTFRANLSYIVGADGLPELSSIRSEGVDGPMAFDRTSQNVGAALAAKNIVRSCVWRPGRLDGEPVRTRVTQQISF